MECTADHPEIDYGGGVDGEDEPDHEDKDEHAGAVHDYAGAHDGYDGYDTTGTLIQSEDESTEESEDDEGEGGAGEKKRTKRGRRSKAAKKKRTMRKQAFMAGGFGMVTKAAHQAMMEQAVEKALEAGRVAGAAEQRLKDVAIMERTKELSKMRVNATRRNAGAQVSKRVAQERRRRKAAQKEKKKKKLEELWRKRRQQGVEAKEQRRRQWGQQQQAARDQHMAGRRVRGALGYQMTERGGSRRH